MIHDLRAHARALRWQLQLITAAGMTAPNLAHDLAEVMPVTHVRSVTVDCGHGIHMRVPVEELRVIRAEDLGGGVA